MKTNEFKSITTSYICASSKGGVGKSSIAMLGAIILPSTKIVDDNGEQTGKKPNVLIDTDPQGTSLLISQNRNERKLAVPRCVAANIGGIAPTIEKHVADKTRHIVIDSPPNVENERIRLESLRNPHVDMCIIPCMMGDDDLEGAINTAKTCVKYGVPFITLMTRAKLSNFLDHQMATLKEDTEALGGALCPHIIYDRITWYEARNAFLTVTEYAPKSKAAAEALAVWKWIYGYTEQMKKDNAKAKKGVTANG